jgi:hypothetical protein
MSVTERFRWNLVVPGDASFSQVPLFRLDGPESSCLLAEPVLDARSLKDRRIFLLKVFGDHEPNQPPIERRSDASAKPT